MPQAFSDPIRGLVAFKHLAISLTSRTKDLRQPEGLDYPARGNDPTAWVRAKRARGLGNTLARVYIIVPFVMQCAYIYW